MISNLPLHFRAAKKNAWRNFKFSVEPILRSKWVQGGLLLSSAFLIVIAGLVFLSNLVGAAIAALSLLYFLEKIFGWKLVTPFENF